MKLELIFKNFWPLGISKITSKTEMELKKRILHLWSWKFFFPWCKWSIFSCHLKEKWIKHQNHTVPVHNTYFKIWWLTRFQTGIPATILYILDIGPTETHVFLLNDQSRRNKMNVHGSHCHLLRSLSSCPHLNWLRAD